MVYRDVKSDAIVRYRAEDEEPEVWHTLSHTFIDIHTHAHTHVEMYTHTHTHIHTYIMCFRHSPLTTDLPPSLFVVNLLDFTGRQSKETVMSNKKFNNFCNANNTAWFELYFDLIFVAFILVLGKYA